MDGRLTMETTVAQVTVGFASPSTAGQATHRQLHLSVIR